MDVNKFSTGFNRRYFINYLRTGDFSQRVIKLCDTILKAVKTYVVFLFASCQVTDVLFLISKYRGKSLELPRRTNNALSCNLHLKHVN